MTPANLLPIVESVATQQRRTLARRYRRQRFDGDGWDALARAGFFRLGLEHPIEEYAPLFVALGAGRDLPFVVSAAVQVMAIQILSKFADPPMAARYVPRVAAGEMAAICNVEVGRGRVTPSFFSVGRSSIQKRAASNLPAAEVFLVGARDLDEDVLDYLVFERGELVTFNLLGCQDPTLAVQGWNTGLVGGIASLNFAWRGEVHRLGCGRGIDILRLNGRMEYLLVAAGVLGALGSVAGELPAAKGEIAGEMITVARMAEDLSGEVARAAASPPDDGLDWLRVATIDALAAFHAYARAAGPAAVRLGDDHAYVLARAADVLAVIGGTRDEVAGRIARRQVRDQAPTSIDEVQAR
jgi:hypothetical protein